ncbi:MAG: PA14 domain-containing protein, partial [Kiritimatiellia bacterium]
FLGSLHGAGKVTMSDTGWVTFAGAANDYTGELVVGSGANTRIGNGETFSWAAETGATITGRLALKMNRDVEMGQCFTGSGTLRKEGTGALTFTQPQAYGHTQVAEGTLRVAEARVLPSGGSRGRLEIEGSGTFDTDGKGVVIGALAGTGRVANRTGAADTLHIDAESTTGDFSGSIDESVTIEKTGANTQTFTAETAAAARVPALVLKEGVVEINKWQGVDRLALAGGTLRVRNGTAGLTGRYYKPASMSGAATALSSLENIAAFEAANEVKLTESSATMGSVFDTNKDGSRFPSAYRGADNFITIWRGTILVPTTGEWTFALCSDDGSALYIDGEKVIDNLKDQGYTTNDQRVNTRRAITLAKGQHDIVIAFYEKTGDNAITAYVTRPGASADEVLPMAMLASIAAGSSTEVASVEEATAGAISFSAEGFPAVAFTQAGDFTLGLPVTGTNATAVLAHRGAGTMTLTGMGNDFDGTLAVDAGTVRLDGSAQVGAAQVAAAGTLALAPVSAGSGRQGLRARYYLGVTTFDYANMKGDCATLDAYLAGLTPSLETTSLSAGATLDFGAKGAGFATGTDNFLLDLAGTIYIPESGAWSFAIDSDDGAAMWIDGQPAVQRALNTSTNDNFGTKGSARELARGLHEIRIFFREATGDQALRVAMKGPSDAGYAYIPQANLFPAGNALRGLAGEAGGRVDLANGLLLLAQDGDTAYAGALVGEAGSLLVKRGDGCLTLAGSLADYAGGIQADEGTVRFAMGGTVNLAALSGVGRIVVENGTHLVVADSTFMGEVEATDGSFTVVARGNSFLSEHLGAMTGDTLGVTGTGTVFLDLADGRLNAGTVRLGGSVTGSVANEGQLGGAAVELDGGTLRLQKTVTPGDTVLADMSDAAAWQFNGVASAQKLDGRAYHRLMPCNGNMAGTAFYRTKVNLAQAWYARFTYHVATNGVTAPADGFSLMFQNEGETAIGGNGGCTAGAIYEEAKKKVIKPAVSIVQRIYNSAANGVYTNGVAVAAYAGMAGFDRTKDVDYTITYDGVRFAIEARQGEAVYTRTVEVDLAAVLGGDEAWVGFTASSGGSYAEQGILDFSLCAAADANEDFSQTAVGVVSNGTGVVSTQFGKTTLKALTLAEGASLTLAAAPGSAVNAPYAFDVATLAAATNTTLTIASNGTGAGTLALGALDCRAGGTLKVVGGSLAAREAPLRIIVPTPLPAGVVLRLVDLTRSAWTGPFSVALVDAQGNPVRARAYLSNGFIKVSTADGTTIFLR